MLLCFPRNQSNRNIERITMPNVPNPNTNQRNELVTILRDIDGSIIIEVGLDEYTIKDPETGTLVHRKSSTNIRLVCGMMWSPAMLVESKHLIGVCQQCRTPRRSLFRRVRGTHGIVSLEQAKHCVDCGQLSCPSHRVLSSDDKWRCISCNKAFNRTNFIKGIFCRKEE